MKQTAAAAASTETNERGASESAYYGGRSMQPALTALQLKSSSHSEGGKHDRFSIYGYTRAAFFRILQSSNFLGIITQRPLAWPTNRCFHNNPNLAVSTLLYTMGSNVPLCTRYPHGFTGIFALHCHTGEEHCCCCFYSLSFLPSLHPCANIQKCA